MNKKINPTLLVSICCAVALLIMVSICCFTNPSVSADEATTKESITTLKEPEEITEVIEIFWNLITLYLILL